LLLYELLFCWSHYTCRERYLSNHVVLMTTYNASIIFLSFEDDFHFEKYLNNITLTNPHLVFIFVNNIQILFQLTIIICNYYDFIWLTKTKIFVDMTEMLLKVVLNTITHNSQPFMQLYLITVLVVVQFSLYKCT
jgi:hypothetical protein